jgi:stress response protein YsnF
MAPAISRTPDRDEGREEKVEVVEERLAVGKREVETGGVRVTSRVVETPVEETVRLREERVEAERRPDDRKLSPEEADAAFAERTVEMMGTGEEAEVGRTARVVEEVTLRKRAGEREATVRDTVRRTEVEVEELEAGRRDERR